MSCGVIISAPAVILSVIFGLNLTATVAMIGVPTVIYTMFGGVQAVAWADVKQMVIIVVGLLAVAVALLAGLPDSVGLGDALRIAGTAGRLQTFDFRFDINETYTFWSGLIGGAFLMLSYFGTDQSQVQRFLTAKSVDQARSSLFMSAYWKIPLQALVLLVGVLVFVYYLFTPPPFTFNPAQAEQVRASERAAEYAALETRFGEAYAARRSAAEAIAGGAGDAETVAAARSAFLAANEEASAARTEALALTGEVIGGSAADVNYVMPTFVLNELPLGLPGIFIAAVLAAAMSSIAAELNSLSTATVIDFYRRHMRPVASDAHYLRVSKITTGLWGLFACVVATYAAKLGSLIEVVNRFGSFFYGSILGVFLLAMVRRATARGAFFGLIAGMSAVGAVTVFAPSVSFLWHNVIGALTVLAVGTLLSLTERPAASIAATP
jgi:Na+/proline symporter